MLRTVSDTEKMSSKFYYYYYIFIVVSPSLDYEFCEDKERITQVRIEQLVRALETNVK